MFCVSSFCYTCFGTEHLQATDTLDFDNISFLDKLVFCMPNDEIDLDIPRYICLTCCSALRISYKFQRMLLKNNKQIRGYFIKLQEGTCDKQSALRINLVDFKKQATRMKRKQQLNNKRERESKETTVNTNKSTNKLKVLKPNKNKVIKKKKVMFEIVIKEEFGARVKKVAKNETKLKGFTKNDFPCKLCDLKNGAKQQNIEESKRDKLDDKLICPICSKVCNKLNEFSYHMLFHDSANLIKCNLCNKLFTTQKQFKRHHTLLHRKETMER